MAKIATKVKVDNGIEFMFNGDVESFKASLEDMSEEMVKALAIHGLSQKLGDSYASAANVTEAKSFWEGTYTNLKAGVWSAGRTNNGGELLRAFVEATGESEENCSASLVGMGKDEKAALRKHPAVACILAQYAATRAAEKAAKLGNGEGLKLELGQFMKA